MVDLANPNLADPDLADPNLAGGFVPTDIDGAVLWLRPDSSYVTTVGGKLSGITDRSDGGHDFAQATDARRPDYNATDSDFGDEPSVQHDHVQVEYLINDTLAQALDGDDQPVTLWMVLRDLNNFGARRWFYLNHSTGSGLVYFGTNATNKHRILKQSDAGANTTVDSASNVDTAAAHVYEFEHDGVNAEIFENNSSIASGSLNIGQTTMNQAAIGARYDGNAPASIKWADIAVWPRVLTSGEKQQLYDYAVSRYGIS